jgi:CO/xanthine dehydrogenase Mo-binding subunit
VLTRDDLKGMNAYFGPVVKDQPVVAVDRVRYVGDIIAAVAAESKDIAEEALELIAVEYEPLAAVFDPAQAMKPGAPILHAESAKSETRLDRGQFRFEKNSNVLSVYHAAQGDVAAGFKEADDRRSSMGISNPMRRWPIGSRAASW